MSRKTSHLLLMGDFNYNDIDWRLETSPPRLDHPATAFKECLERLLSVPACQRSYTLQRKPDAKYPWPDNIKWGRNGRRHRTSSAHRKKPPCCDKLQILLLHGRGQSATTQIYLSQGGLWRHEPSSIWDDLGCSATIWCGHDVEGLDQQCEYPHG